MPRIGRFLILCVIACACAGPSRTDGDDDSSSRSDLEVLRVSDVEWEPLNPARGDQSPMAGTLWGDRHSAVATGFLLAPVDGFESPPHIHNVSYRGVVIRGLLHNADPDAKPMWMPTGSFWTQPRGGVHITAAEGASTLAYIEIDDGPYLVQPPDEEFSTGERPVNVHASNLVWVEAPGAWNPSTRPGIAYLWGRPTDGELNGRLIRLPAGFRGTLQTRDGATVRAVVIAGRVRLDAVAASAAEALEPGSYFSSGAGVVHELACDPSDECIVYVRTSGNPILRPAS